MTESFLKSLAMKRNNLLPLIYTFNICPAKYIHVSWIDHIIKGVFFERLRKNKRAEKRISSLILERFELEGKYFFDFEEQCRRLALIDLESLSNLVFFAGTALNAKRLSGIIERETLLSLKKDIGEKVYQFALKRAPILIGRVEAPFVMEQQSSGYRQHIMQCGMKCLKACFDGEPAALTKRLLFKLHSRFSQDFEEQVQDIEKDRAWNIMRKILLMEVNPGWAPYFS